VAKIHPGATLTPHFRDFLPAWVSRQPWYAGTGVPSLAPVGYFRLGDPAGAVGIETHLVSDGSQLYQLPMTYRDAPLDGADSSLITAAEHSVLGTRWIYDGPADPVWVEVLLDLVRTGGVSEHSTGQGAGPAEARGRALGRPGILTRDTVAVDLKRVVIPGDLAPDRGIIGPVTGSWYPRGSGAAPATGCLAVVRERTR
jgi:Maltokinase N-terminal cap domain